MTQTKTSFSYELSGDRPPTPRGPSRNDSKRSHPHPLRGNPTSGPKSSSNGNVASRPMPANPPSSPVSMSDTCSRPSSPSLPAHGRPKSPLSPPVTPPRTPSSVGNTASFQFSKRVMRSKKLSSSVHGKPEVLRLVRQPPVTDTNSGTLTQPVVYDLSDDD